MATEVDLQALVAAHRDGAFVVDVREPEEYVGGHVPGAVLIPLRDVPTRLGELPKERPVYVICRSGNRSLTAADWMAAAGVDARSVAGGTSAWIEAGGRVVSGPNPEGG